MVLLPNRETKSKVFLLILLRRTLILRLMHQVYRLKRNSFRFESKTSTPNQCTKSPLNIAIRNDYAVEYRTDVIRFVMTRHSLFSIRLRTTIMRLFSSSPIPFQLGMQSCRNNTERYRNLYSCLNVLSIRKQISRLTLAPPLKIYNDGSNLR